jgi:hypothetical protein
VLLPELKASLLRRGAAGSRQFAPNDEWGSDFRVGQAVAGEPGDLSRPGVSWAGYRASVLRPVRGKRPQPAEAVGAARRAGRWLGGSTDANVGVPRTVSRAGPHSQTHAGRPPHEVGEQVAPLIWVRIAQIQFTHRGLLRRTNVSTPSMREERRPRSFMTSMMPPSARFRPRPGLADAAGAGFQTLRPAR